MEKTILLLGLFVAIGKVFDILSLKSEKKSVYNKLKLLLQRIDKTNFPDIHKLAINSIVTFFKKQFSFNRRIFSTVFKLIVVSWLLTTLLSLLGRSLDVDSHRYNVEVWHDYLPWYPIYIVNLITDCLTLLVSFLLLNWIKNKSFFIAVPILITDAILAYLIYVFCLFSITVVSEFADKHKLGSSYLASTSVLHRTNIPFEDEKLDKILFEHYFPKDDIYHRIINDGFSSNAKVSFSKWEEKGINANFNMVKELLTIQGAKKYILNREVFNIDIDKEIVVQEGGRNKTYRINFVHKPSLSKLLLSASTLIPTIVLVQQVANY